MKHSYKILFFFCLITTISNGQISEYSKLADIEPVKDLGFEYFARGLQALSNRVVSNKSEANLIVRRVQEVYENKLDEGCGNDFIDLYSTKYNIIITKVNSSKIDITTNNGVENLRAEMYSLERELNRYNCSQKSISTTSKSPFNSYRPSVVRPSMIKTSSDETINTIVNNTIPTKTVRLRTILWSDCDVDKREFVSFVDKDTIVNIMSYCENKIKNSYFFILENGKAGYLGYNDVEN